MELRFAVRQERTILETMRFNGPLRVQRPFYPEAAPQDAPGRQQPSQPCHCCLLHPPGGLVSGDDLHLAVGLEHGAHVLLTAPSASKFYAADACNVRQRQSTEVRAAGGVLEWLPRETIIYDGARAELHTAIELDAASLCLGWEMICLGRPAAGEAFTHGSVRQSLNVTRQGRPLLHELLRLEGGDDLQGGAFGLDGMAVAATLFAVGRGQEENEASAPGDPSEGNVAARDLAALEECCAVLQNMLAPADAFAQEEADATGSAPARLGPPWPAALTGARAGVTVRNGVLVLRYLGPDMEEARGLLLSAWNLLRPRLTGCAPHMPRIWHGAF